MSLKSKLEKNFSETAKFIEDRKLFENPENKIVALIMTTLNTTQHGFMAIAEELQVLEDKISKLKK